MFDRDLRSALQKLRTRLVVHDTRAVFGALASHAHHDQAFAAAQRRFVEQLVRAAGGVAQLQAKDGKWAIVLLPSGTLMKINLHCRATIGQIGNIEHNLINYGKAGRMRWLGRRPKVRGSAMNPVAHPMGGGEGRRAGGRHPVSFSGVPAKGGKTRKKRKTSQRRIIRGRKKGKHQR